MKLETRNSSTECSELSAAKPKTRNSSNPSNPKLFKPETLQTRNPSTECSELSAAKPFKPNKSLSLTILSDNNKTTL
jgi:hypothetical protein